MTIKLIGIAGKAKAGKDTLGAHLVRHRGYKRMAFADPLKEAMAAVFGIPLAEFHDEDLKDEVQPYWGITRRAMLQRGADALRGGFSQYHFIARWRLEYLTAYARTATVVTDVRSDGEAQAIRDLDGIIVRLSRANGGLEGVEAQHHTERPLSIDLEDYEIDNNGTRQEMFDLVDEILGKLK